MTLRHHLVSKPSWTFVGLAIALVGCVTLKPNEQASSTSNAGGRDGGADADASEARATGGGGGKDGSGAGGSDRLDASDADFAPDAEGASGGENTADGDGASDGHVPEPCVDPCDSQGLFGCSPTGVVQACLSSGRCLVWRDIGACPKEHVCCSGVCVNDDGLVAPTCSNPTPAGYELYVDASAVESDATDGSRTRPFRTITRALRAVGQDGAALATRIYVARGRYDAKLGEEFPLIVPGGVTLDGAGAVRTTIAGIRYFDPVSRGVPMGANTFMTMVLGDKNLPNRVSGFTVVPGDAVPIPNYVGIWCDRGTPVTDGGDNGPNTTLSDLVVGPGYERGIWATGAAPGEPPCNLRLRASTIIGGRFGLSAGWCDEPSFLSNLEVGDGTEAGGNTFKSQTTDDGYGIGANLMCVKRFDFSYNTFTLGNEGLYIGTLSANPPNEERGKLRHNKFDRLDWKGVSIWGSGIMLEEFTDNEFTNITMNRGPSLKGMAIGLEVHNSGDLFFPQIDQARRNFFYRCDTAIYFAHPGTFLPTMSVGDFGKDKETDPGNNTFHCNGSYTRNGGVTSVFFDFANTPMPVGIALFQGNLWDTTLPDPVTTAQKSPPWPTGEVFRRSDNVMLNYTGAKLATPNGANACPP